MQTQSMSFFRCINEITTLIQNEMKTANRCGLSIALVDDKGTIWSEGFGYTDRTNRERVTADTLFSIQSMTKCFTATAFLILASKGLLGLDDPIRKHYPKFNVNTKFGDAEEEIAKITFRRMLSHWSGFTHEAPVGNNYDTTPCTFEEHIQSVSNSWLRSPVGSEHAYSNIGIDLTGYVMGLVMNKAYEEVMNEVLFFPLGIVKATFNIDEALESTFAKGHGGQHATPFVQVPMIPAGGLYISANEVAKFVSFHLRKGKIDERQIIETSLFEEMYKPQFLDSKEFGYGLGVYSFEYIKGCKVFDHGGGGYGYQTLMRWVPEHNIGVVLLTNDMKDSSTNKLTTKVLESLIELKSEPETKPIEVESLRRLEGTYLTYRRPLLNIVCRNEMLYLYQMDGSETELFSQDETKFITKNGTKCSFNLDEEGYPLSFNVENALLSFRAKYNDGPNDTQGPNNNEWNDVIGVYQFQGSGKNYCMAITILNGYLYLISDDCLKLHHLKDNIYFTVDGEVVLLAKDNLIYKNIPATKIEMNLDQLVESIKLDRIKFDSYNGLVSSLVNILIATRSFDETLSFIEQVVEIDTEFKANYSMLGKRLHTLGRNDESLICFTKLLEIDSEDHSAAKMIREIELRQEFHMKFSSN